MEISGNGVSTAGATILKSQSATPSEIPTATTASPEEDAGEAMAEIADRQIASDVVPHPPPVTSGFDLS